MKCNKNIKSSIKYKTPKNELGKKCTRAYVGKNWQNTASGHQRKLEDIPYSWMGGFNIVKYSPPNWSNRFYVTPCKSNSILVGRRTN